MSTNETELKKRVGTALGECMDRGCGLQPADYRRSGNWTVKELCVALDAGHGVEISESSLAAYKYGQRTLQPNVFEALVGVFGAMHGEPKRVRAKPVAPDLETALLRMQTQQAEALSEFKNSYEALLTRLHGSERRVAASNEDRWAVQHIPVGIVGGSPIESAKQPAASCYVLPPVNHRPYVVNLEIFPPPQGSTIESHDLLVDLAFDIDSEAIGDETYAIGLNKARIHYEFKNCFAEWGTKAGKECSNTHLVPVALRLRTVFDVNQRNSDHGI